MGNKVFLKVSAMKGIVRFGRKRKLSPRYVGSYEIVQKIWKVCCNLELLPEIYMVHSVFKVKMLR